MYAEVELILDLSTLLARVAFVGGLVAKRKLQFYNNEFPILIEDTN